MRTIVIKLAVVSALALSLAGCGTARGMAPEATTTPGPLPNCTLEPTPDQGEGSAPAITIKGNLSEVRTAEGEGILGVIRVEGEKIEGNEYGRADLRITTDTRIFESKDGELVPVDFAALEFGQFVEAKMVGPIAESWPVQAKAGEVVILLRAPKN